MEEDYLEEIIWTCSCFCGCRTVCGCRKKDKTKQQAPALELPIVPSKPDHSKKAILVVSFGTSYEETREKQSVPSKKIFAALFLTLKCAAPSPAV